MRPLITFGASSIGVRRLRAVLLSRLSRGIGANAYGQAVNLGLQLSMVPVLATHWGVDTYGIWILLFGIPSYFALGDFGFATAAGTDMTIRVAAGDQPGAVTTFQSAFGIIFCVSTILIVAAFITAVFFPSGTFTGTMLLPVKTIRAVFILFSIYGVICLSSSLVLAGFRCCGHYATGVATQATVQLVEGVMCIVLVSLNAPILIVAAGFPLCRITGMLMQALALRAKVNWLTLGVSHFSKVEVKRLLRPALAVMAIPTAQAIFLQGTALVLGLAASGVNVATFTTVRTLIRTGVQLTTLMNHAIMPEFTVAVATRDARRRRMLTLLTVGTSAIVLLPAAGVLLIEGPRIVAIWTHGVITPSWRFMFLMTCVMMLNGAWHPLSNLILAANQHYRYSYIYLLAALTAVVICYPLSLKFQESGAAVSLICLDLFMLIHVIRLIVRFEGSVCYEANSLSTRAIRVGIEEVSGGNTRREGAL